MVSEQAYGHCPPCHFFFPVPEGTKDARCPQCGMRIRLLGAEVEVSGQSADEVRSVAESIIETLLSRSPIAMLDEAHEVIDTGRIERPDDNLKFKLLNINISIFVSHSSRDVKWIESELIPWLKGAGLAPWYSKDDIRGAGYWEREILIALDRCEWFLIVLSPSSAVSEWVKDELHWAVTHRENRIIPVIIEKCNLQSFHIRLSRIEAIDWRPSPAKARERIIDAIHQGVPKVVGGSAQMVPRRRWWEFWK